MSSLRPPPSPSPSPVQGANGKNASARASMGPAARPSAGTQQGFTLASPRPGGGPPSGRPTSELLGSATFQTPECEHSTRFYLFSLFVIVRREVGFGWLERSSAPINSSATTYRDQYAVLRRRSLAFPHSVPTSGTCFGASPPTPSHDESWVMCISSIFLLIYL